MANILLSAHRCGPEGRFAPNSLQAAEAARTEGIDMIEFDVRVTADSQFVVLHDARVTLHGHTVPVAQLPASKVLEYAPNACLLQDMLHMVKGYAAAHVDLKDTAMEVEIADLCESILGADGFILTTWEDESVAKLRRERPHLQVALSLGRDTRGMAPWKALRIHLSEIFPGRRIQACRPTMLAINYRLTEYGVLDRAARYDLPVLLWTINSQQHLAKILQDGRIWALTTNYPRRALELKRQQAVSRPTLWDGAPEPVAALFSSGRKALALLGRTLNY